MYSVLVLLCTTIAASAAFAQAAAGLDLEGVTEAEIRQEQASSAHNLPAAHDAYNTHDAHAPPSVFEKNIDRLPVAPSMCGRRMRMLRQGAPGRRLSNCLEPLLVQGVSDQQIVDWAMNMPQPGRSGYRRTPEQSKYLERVIRSFASDLREQTADYQFLQPAAESFPSL